LEYEYPTNRASKGRGGINESNSTDTRVCSRVEQMREKLLQSKIRGGGKVQRDGKERITPQLKKNAQVI